MTEALYTPDTLRLIREASQNQYREDIAEQLGWDVSRLARVCQRHGISVTSRSEVVALAEKLSTLSEAMSPSPTALRRQISTKISPGQRNQLKWIANLRGKTPGSIVREFLRVALSRPPKMLPKRKVRSDRHLPMGLWLKPNEAQAFEALLKEWRLTPSEALSRIIEMGLAGRLS